MNDVFVTCIKNGRFDQFGRPLVSGSSYTLSWSLARDLWLSGYVSVTDAAVFDQDPLAGSSPLDDFNIARSLSLSRQPEQTRANLAAELAAINSVIAQITTTLAAGGEYSILINGDSTGAYDTRWPRLLATSLAARFTVATVLFRHWDDTGSVWPAPTVVQSGPQGKIIINNGAVSGTTPMYLQGSKFRNFISVRANLLIINHGHNLGSGSLTASTAKKAEFLNGIESSLSVLGPIPVMIVAQNSGSTLLNSSRAIAARELAYEIGAICADVYEAFINAGNGVDLQDDTHPTDNVGSPLFSATILSAMTTKPADSLFPIQRNAKNGVLIDNGLFVLGTANAVPSGFSGANLAVTDVTQPGAYESGTRALSIIAASGTGQAYLQYSVPIADVNAAKGRVLTLGVRLNIPSSAPATSGRIDLSSSGGVSVSQTYPALTYGRDGYKWCFVAIDVPLESSSISAKVYADSSSTPTTNPAHAVIVDRVSLSIGRRIVDPA